MERGLEMTESSAGWGRAAWVPSTSEDKRLNRRCAVKMARHTGPDAGEPGWPA